MGARIRHSAQRQKVLRKPGGKFGEEHCAPKTTSRFGLTSIAGRNFG